MARRFDALAEDWNRLCDRWSECGYDSLNETEKLWLNVRRLIGAVNNGGLISYFYNSHAEHYDDCVHALNQLMEPEVLNEVQNLGALFGATVPVSIEERNRIKVMAPRLAPSFLSALNPGSAPRRGPLTMPSRLPKLSSLA